MFCGICSRDTASRDSTLCIKPATMTKASLIALGVITLIVATQLSGGAMIGCYAGGGVLLLSGVLYSILDYCRAKKPEKIKKLGSSTNEEHDLSTKAITLSEYKQATLEERQEMLVKSGFEDQAQLPVVFWEHLGITLDSWVDSEASHKHLPNFTLKNVYFWQHNLLPLHTLKTPQLSMLSVEDLSQLALNTDQVNHIRRKAKKLTTIPIEEDNIPLHLYCVGALANIPQQKLPQLLAEVNEKKNMRLITPAFYFFTDQQISSLKLLQLDSSHVNALFNFEGQEALHQRIVLFTQEDVLSSIHNQLWTNPNLLRLPDPFFHKLGLSKLTPEQINNLFPHSTTRRKFALLQQKEVQAALEKDLLDQDRLKLMSDSHIKNLKISELPKEVITKLYSAYSQTSHLKERFKLINANELLKARGKELLSNEILGDIKWA
ncbi:MAG: hypothetical protein K940chlam9_01233 [Chlamydiae bacterium]|nr:hypothetical protein [Chlamydiota bacterium]